MDVKKSVAAVQLEILNQVIERELSVSQLYEKFAGNFPRFAELWTGLAAEERAHAQLLRNMESYIQQGHLLWNLGKLKEEELNEEQKLVDDANLKLRMGRMDPLKALNIAFEIENSLLDSKFYDVVNCDLPEFQKTAEELRRSEEQHRNRLEEAITSLTGR